MRVRAIATAAAFVAALSAPAVAQRALVDFMKEAGLGNAEVESMTAAEAALYGKADVAPGAVETWATPQAEGVARVTFVGPRADGRPCVAIRHAITPKGRTQIIDVPVRRCRMDDGRWLIAAE
jgi:hypothetical protein